MDYIAESHLLKEFITVLEDSVSSSGDRPAAPSPFSCRPFRAVTAERDTVISRFQGEISIENLEEFKRALDELVTDRLHKFILDLSTVTLTPTAMGVLVNFAAGIYGRNKKLYIYNPSQQVRDSLGELHLARMFNVLETHEDILIAIFI